VRKARFLDFDLATYRERLRRLESALGAGGLDGVLLTTRDNVEYLTGFTTPSWRLGEKRFWFLFAPGHEPVLFVDMVHEVNARETTWIEDLRIWGSRGSDNLTMVREALEGMRVDRGRVGMELGPASFARITTAEFDRMRSLLPHVRFVDADETVGRVRMVKTTEEIDRIARACEITEAGIKAGFSAARPGATEREILQRVVSEWLRLGADDPYYSTNCGYAALQAGRVLQMTPSPVDRKIEKGDLIQLDCGAVFRGYVCDMYRNAYVGAKLPAALDKYSEGTRFVIDSIFKAIRPGVLSSELCAAGERAIREIGFEKYRRPLSNAVGGEKGVYVGHGLGFSVHEYPTIAPGDQTPWVEGMCGAIEIPFGDQENGYVQWEDDFVVTKDGARLLTPSPKEIYLTG
jgi:Xaa-Pro aminopeptidase